MTSTPSPPPPSAAALPAAVLPDATLPQPARRRPHMPRKFWIGAVIVGGYAVAALLAPVLAPADPMAQDVANRLADPGTNHLLGTDELGRDVFSRLVHGIRVDLMVGFLGAFFPLVVGTLLGALAGYLGGWADVVIMRITDLVQGFPVYILIIALVFALGPGIRTILIAFTAIAWVIYARIIRDAILRVRSLDYVQAARAAGIPHHRILLRHVIPNTIHQSVIYFTSDVLFAILAVAAFSFLGLGVPPPTPEWGSMIAEGQPYLRDQWWLAAAPGVAIVGIGLGLSLLGDGVDDRWRR
ncbi:ABC transporter permease [Phytoactinopolyspora limicola]|uniref:ABC transporter permease n=1 Tax=Phytoactinopolyspora limicola TaxID=2715536 RepID=UPI00140DAB15|nr:ABC transporter permease [Phytoactinopolyspora limicola]